MTLNELREQSINAALNNDNINFLKYSKELLDLLYFKMLEQESTRFIGYFLLNMVKQIDLDFPAAAGVNIIDSKIILYLNPVELIKDTDNDICLTFEHEVLHIILNHISRADHYKHVDKHDHNLLNKCMDVSINEMLSRPVSNEERWYLLKHLETQYEVSLKSGDNFENHYNTVYQSKKYQDSKSVNESTNQPPTKPQESAGGSQSESQKPNNQPEATNQPQSLRDKYLNGVKNKSCSHIKWKEGDPSDGEGHKNLIKDILNNFINEKGRELIPGHINTLIDALFTKPEIPWQKILRRMLGDIKIPYRKTIMKRDRRQSDRFDLKGRVKKTTVEITIAIDTSGSVSSSELKYFFKEIFHILKAVEYKLTIIECDTTIAREYTVEKIKDINTKVYGRGGTAFTPVIEHINKKSKKPQLLIYFTDGGGESTVPNPKGYHILWITTGKIDNFSVKNLNNKSKIKKLNMV